MPRVVPTLAAFYSTLEQQVLELGGLQRGRLAPYRSEARVLLDFLRDEILVRHPELFGQPTALWDKQLQWTYTSVMLRMYANANDEFNCCRCWLVCVCVCVCVCTCVRVRVHV